MSTKSVSKKTASNKSVSGNTASRNPVSVNQWRPLKEIQVKVIGLCVNRKQLLAMDVLDDRGELKGVRPLGGHVEYGETREAALHREFKEELGTEIVTAGNWRVFENIYQHEGELGHEYIFAISTALVDRSLYAQQIIVFSEDSGMEVKARWYDIKDLRSGKIALFPDGLAETL